jgi:hypothetical protein
MMPNRGLLTAIEDHAGFRFRGQPRNQPVSAIECSAATGLAEFLTVAVASAATVNKMPSKKSVFFAGPEEDTSMQI